MKIVRKIVVGLLVGVIGICLGFSFIQPLLYREYYSTMEKEWKVDGLMDGFIPQGLTYVEEENVWLYTGYMKDEQPSRLYVVDEDSSRYIELYTPEGMYEGHAGGISYENDVVYLASGGSGESNRIYMFALSEVLDENTTQLVMENHFHPYTKASYCYVNNGMLWVGEFEDGGQYTIDESHYINGNRAFIAGYALHDYGLVDEEVDVLLSSVSRVQGMAMNEDGKIALSTSYGFSNSHLKLYESLSNQKQDSFMLDGRAVPIYMLDDTSIIKDVEAPQMAEGIVFKDGRLYVLYESASLKYYFGIFTKGKYIHSYEF